MSHFATPEGEQEGGRKEARPPFGADSQFYSALGQMTISAIEAIVGSEPSLTRGPVVGGGSVPATVPTDDPPQNLSFLGGSSVRANATGAGSPESRPGSGCSRCIDWDERRRDLYGELT